MNSNNTNSALVIVTLSVGTLLVWAVVTYLLPLFNNLTNTVQALGL